MPAIFACHANFLYDGINLIVPCPSMPIAAPIFIAMWLLKTHETASIIMIQAILACHPKCLYNRINYLMGIILCHLDFSSRLCLRTPGTAPVLVTRIIHCLLVICAIVAEAALDAMTAMVAGHVQLLRHGIEL